MSRPEVLVIGSGVMGRGIAVGFAAAGMPMPSTMPASAVRISASNR